MARFRVIVGDVRERLRDLPVESVQCVVTSPPYWGLRDYGVEGQLGLEKTPEEYVANMVEVFREVRRVLRPDGVAWVNLGDSYATGTTSDRKQSQTGKHGYWKNPAVNKRIDGREFGLKPKDLVGIPWMVAFALRADGWWLRMDVVWAKPNPMPESVTDRPTKSHEYLFLLTKSDRYFYDGNAIREPFADERMGRDGGKGDRERNVGGRCDGFTRPAGIDPSENGGRNKRSVWTIATQPFPEAHFATFPEALVEPCILAGSKVGDIVLDPFVGSGTVGVVALKHGRDFLGIELKPAYAEMAERRIAGDSPLFNVSANDSGPHAPGEDGDHAEGEVQPLQTVFGQVVDE